ncbi:MAG TPA: DUF4253 domain-containing protein [Kofleriaceae bacterium]|jgi:hypothetical protein
MSYRAGRPGALPAERDAIVGGVRLPPGRRIAAGGDEPVLWISEQPLRDAAARWRELARGYANHGLWPLLMSTLHDDGGRPWLTDELDLDRVSDPGAHDALAVLADSWQNVLPASDDELGVVAPLGRSFPGLAAATTGDPLSIGDAVEDTTVRLGLVAVARPADAVAAIGWSGPLNHTNDVAELCAVMRTWEDRFGAYVVAVGFDTLAIGVERPPRDTTTALAIAAEHFAFCPDNIWQGSGKLAAYVEHLIDAPMWGFWWD